MYLGIDYGRVRIGLALGRVLPQGTGVLNSRLPLKEIIERIGEIVSKNDVEGIVLGLPTRNQGEAGTLVPEIQSFAQKIAEELSIPVFFEEEKFSSAEAEMILSQSEKKYPRSSGKVDELAAILILEQFLGRLKEDQNIIPDINAGSRK